MRMTAPTIAFFLANPASVALAQGIIPVDNLKITRDTNFKNGEFTVRDAKGDGAIRIVKNDLFLDGHGAVLDAASSGGGGGGIGLVVEGVENVVIKNITFRNFKTGLVARKITNLTLDNVSCPENHNNSEPAESSAVYAAGIMIENSNGVHVLNCNVSKKPEWYHAERMRLGGDYKSTRGGMW